MQIARQDVAWSTSGPQTPKRPIFKRLAGPRESATGHLNGPHAALAAVASRFVAMFPQRVVVSRPSVVSRWLEPPELPLANGLAVLGRALALREADYDSNSWIHIRSYAILVSDRRISWVDKDGKINTHEDTENKAIVLAGQFIMGYRVCSAGVRRKKTEQWVAKLANVAPQDHSADFGGSNRGKIAGMRVPLNRSGHAFLAAGFAFTPFSPSRLEAYW